MAHLAHRCSSARPHDVRPLLLMMLIRPADLMHAPPARQCSSAGRLMALRLAGSAAHAPARRPPRCRILPARRCSSMPRQASGPPMLIRPPSCSSAGRLMARRPAAGPSAQATQPARRCPPTEAPTTHRLTARPLRSIHPPADAHRSTHPMRSIPAC